MWIDDIEIGIDRTYVIAEISGSHAGSLSKMQKLIEVASQSGADAVKVQKFRADDLVVKDYKYYEVLKNLEFSNSDWKKIISFAKEFEIPILVDIFDSDSVNFLNMLGVAGFKVHTTDINNLELIKNVAGTGKPIFLSIGASTLKEIELAKYTVFKYHQNLILMYGFQSYPTPVEEVKLPFIPILKENFNLNIGFSDHTPGGSIESYSVPLISTALGASVIEKHITLNRSLMDPDYQSALNPDEFKDFVEVLRRIEEGLKYSGFELSDKEIDYAEIVKRRVVAKKHISEGQMIKKSDLCFKRAPKGMFMNSLNIIIGRRSRMNLNPDDPITQEVLL